MEGIPPTVDAGLPETRRMLEQGVESRFFYCAAQVYVSVDGECVLDVAAGLARPGVEATTDHVFPVWCVTKPVAALAVMHLCDRGLFDVDRPLGDFVPEWKETPIGAVTARQALAYRAGIPPALRLPGTFPGQRSLVTHLAGLPLTPPGNPVYTPSLGMLAITAALRKLGIELEETVQDEVLGPLGIGDIWLPIRAHNLALDRWRLGTSWMQLRDTFRPFSTEGLELGAFPDLAMGGYASARAIGRFYEALLNGEVKERGIVTERTFEAMVSPAGPDSHDPVLQRECNYGLGFMVDLAKHEFGEGCSSASYGHSGGTGYMVAFADPRDGLVVMANIPTLEIGGNLLAMTSRRPQLLQTIRRDLGLPTA